MRLISSSIKAGIVAVKIVILVTLAAILFPGTAYAPPLDHRITPVVLQNADTRVFYFMCSYSNVPNVFACWETDRIAAL